MFRNAVTGILMAFLCVAVNSSLLIRTGRAQEGDLQNAAQSEAVGKQPTHAITTPTVPHQGTAASQQNKASQAAQNSQALKLRPGEQIGEVRAGKVTPIGHVHPGSGQRASEGH